MLKVAVVDDHTLFRKSLVLLMRSFKGIDPVVEANSGSMLLEVLAKKQVDVILLDIQMPVMDGYATCRAITELYPDIKILIVSHLMTKESIHKSMEAGAHGYFSKNAEPNDLETAIKNIHDKGFYFEQGLGSILHEVILWDKKDATTADPLATLSERELKIISLFCEGYSSIEIADKLCINIRTVESYRNKIIDKTNAKNFTSVILMSIKYGRIPIEMLLSKV